MSLPAAAAGAVWAKAEEINTVKLQIEGLLLGCKTPQQTNRGLYAAGSVPQFRAGHCTFKASHFKRAAAKWRALTWPKPLICSGTRAISTAKAWLPTLS